MNFTESRVFIRSIFIRRETRKSYQWNEFGNWFYQNLINPVSEVTPALQAEVAALNLTGSTHDKVKKLYQYMQSKTRYVAIMEGIGGWKPMLVEDVRKKDMVIVKH